MLDRYILRPCRRLTDTKLLTSALTAAKADPLYSPCEAIELLFELGRIHLGWGDDCGATDLFEFCVAEYSRIPRRSDGDLDGDADEVENLKQSAMPQVLQMVMKRKLSAR